ncbi:MAG: tol-pal system YbgF family protein, partial [Bradymonadaceae bacterium]
VASDEQEVTAVTTNEAQAPARDESVDEELEKARQAFEEFLKQHANDDRTDQAQFHLGEIHYKEGKWVSGIFDFRKVIKNYPDSDLKPEATYQIGVGFLNLKKCDKAKPFFETVVADYGNSPQAPKAQTKLDAIKRGECGK